MTALTITATQSCCLKMSRFVTGNVLSALIANINSLGHRVVVNGLVLRIVMDSLILRVVMDGLGLGNPLVLVRRGVILL